jgi:hypothetical protein
VEWIAALARPSPVGSMAQGISERRARAAASRRVARLERALRRLGAPPRSPLGALLLGMLGPATLGLTAIVTLAIAMTPPPPPPPPPYTPPLAGEPITPAPLLGAKWFPQTGVAPTVVDVDGDGVQDFLGLAWTTGGGSVYAVAFDGASFAEKWHAGPFPAIWNASHTAIVVAHGQVLVTDEGGSLHVLDLATGKETRTITTQKGFEEVCALAARRDGPPAVLVRSSRHGGEPEVLDLASGILARAAAGASCDERARGCDRVTGVCRARDEQVRSLVKPGTFFGWDTLAPHPGEKDGPRVTLGWSEDGARWGVGWKPGAAKPTWNHGLVASGDVDHGGHREDVVDGQHVYYMYQADRDPNLGPYRLVAWSLATGDLAWRTTLPRSAEGSHVSAIGVGGGHVFVVMNQTLHVFDARSGAHQKAIESL